MTTTHAIETVGLTKSYGDHAVLRGVDLRVVSGTILALLGSNGAGKTMVVKILSTLLKSDGGSAVVNGFDVATQPAKVCESISLTGQFAAIDEILTGRENLMLVAELRHPATTEAGRCRVRETVVPPTQSDGRPTSQPIAVPTTTCRTARTCEVPDP